MATTMILVRMRASEKPASIKKIILPPLFMSTGALMFLFPMFRLQFSDVLEALLVGIFFFFFLIKFSIFDIKNNDIFLIHLILFLFILICYFILTFISTFILVSYIYLGVLFFVFI